MVTPDALFTLFGTSPHLYYYLYYIINYYIYTFAFSHAYARAHTQNNIYAYVYIYAHTLRWNARHSFGYARFKVKKKRKVGKDHPEETWIFPGYVNIFHDVSRVYDTHMTHRTNVELLLTRSSRSKFMSYGKEDFFLFPLVFTLFSFAYKYIFFVSFRQLTKLNHGHSSSRHVLLSWWNIRHNIFWFNV